MVDNAPLPSRALKINTLVVLGLTATALGLPVVGVVVALMSPVPSRSQFIFSLSIIVFTPPLVVFGAAVFLSVFRQSHKATRVATGFYFTGTGLAVIGIIANIGEAIEKGSQLTPGFVASLVGIGFGIAAYAGYCGILSLRWGRHLAESTANPRVERSSSED